MSDDGHQQFRLVRDFSSSPLGPGDEIQVLASGLAVGGWVIEHDVLNHRLTIATDFGRLEVPGTGQVSLIKTLAQRLE